MRVVEEAPTNGQVAAFVMTGDGRTEQKVLSAIAEVYNGQGKFLLFPKSHFPKKSGLGVLEGIDEVFKLTGHTRFLVLLDREHFTKERFQSKLRELFNDYTLEGDNPYIVTTKQFEIFVVVFGNKNAIEEHIAELINLESQTTVISTEGSDVQSLKAQIRTFLKTSRHKKLKRFLKSCSTGNLEKAFDPLISVIRMFEET
ncbi:hypothetical protein A3L11_08275 [Thermococcus siculi]|uniref:Uncharacterized protein n=1 Tax=Thermococcus siculi TaxID=72803 RepID=A0A2Z2MLH6_9EURY|nr:hypothetical protein [Thermococcus siculi]ASJ09222.1 hypothetical protein A3L11_08275 [Thermococcus siculi]